MIPISVGIMAYNEEQNIASLLKAILLQSFDDFVISEIIVVCSGCTDKTIEIVQSLAQEYKKIKLICEFERKGKYSGINLFLKEAQSDILVLESGDTLPKRRSLQRLCEPLLDDKIGICASRPIPRASENSLLDKVVKLQWDIHHSISLKTPKFGELIAFKKVFASISPTSVDEEEIARNIYSEGFKGKYVPKAIVYNFGPRTFSDFIKQRSRIYGGHLALKKSGYEVPSLNNFNLFLTVFSFLKLNRLFLFLLSLLLEGISRIYGGIEFFIFKKYNFVWESCESTKHSFDINFSDYSIIIPTLNESKNITKLIDYIFKLYPNIKIIISDDNSVDGTFEIMQDYLSLYPNLRFLHRKHERIRGLTISVLDAVQTLETPNFIVMDGDFQHPPEVLIEFIEALQNYDLVVGSRRSVRDWSLIRRIISLGATILAKISLSRSKANCKDIMSGFFGSKSKIWLQFIGSHYRAFELEGYKVLFDFLKHNSRKLDVRNIEYDFGLRKLGTSKIGTAQIKAFLRSLFR